MKLLSTLFLALASLPVLTTSAAAQAAPVPNITSVPQRKAHAPGNVAINGTNMGIVTQVLVNGVPRPIQRATPARLVVGPVPPQDPGFGTVEVISGRSTDSAPIQFLPTLTAARQGVRVTLVLNNGDVGTYTLRFSYSQAAPPQFDLGIYGPRLLPLSSSTLLTGVFTDANPVTLPGIRMPIVIGGIGNPLRMQAECFAATSGVTSYTNQASVPGYGF